MAERSRRRKTVWGGGGGGGGAPMGGGGLAILLSVHQPSHFLLQMMRGLVVMAPGGRLLYGGPRLLRGGKPTPSNACTPHVSRLQPHVRGGLRPHSRFQGAT